jgi:diphthamide synthase (EF-2-diphthine--ammonia ligase)
MSGPEPILFCWSGGKDSAMALHTLLQQKQFHVAALLTTVTEGYDRIAMHGVRRELLRQQAESLRCCCTKSSSPEMRQSALRSPHGRSVAAHFLRAGHSPRSIRRHLPRRPPPLIAKNLARVAMQAIFPIWKRETRDLIREFHAARFRSVAVCIDSKVLCPQLRRP